MTSSPEEEILKKACQGNTEAFEQIVISYEKPLYNLAFRFFSQPEDAMDVVQEVFLKIYQSLSSFRWESKFSTWVYRVCVNTCLDFLRKKSRFPSVSLDEPLKWEDSSHERQLQDPGDDVSHIAEKREMAQRLMEIVEALDPHYRAIIILCDVEGYSYQETADILGVSIGTVKSRLHRARNLLRVIYNSEQKLPSFVKPDGRRER